MGIASDHPAVDSVRATLARRGSTRRLQVAVPAADRDRFPAGEVVRLVLGGHDCYAAIEAHPTDDRRLIAGAFDAPGQAREPGAGTDRLGEWVDDSDLEAGGSVLVDVLEPGFRYGLRAPGERVVYGEVSSPDDSLASIAEGLDAED